MLNPKYDLERYRVKDIISNTSAEQVKEKKNKDGDIYLIKFILPRMEVKVYQRVRYPIEFTFLELLRPFGLAHRQVVVLLLGRLAVDLPLRARLR